MSWAQRRGPSRPGATATPPVQMYNPNQHSNNTEAYGNVQYSQQLDQNNVYASAGQQQSTVEPDAWSSWGWGDDDNSNAQPVSQQPQAVVSQPIAESFANDESWNWSVDAQQQQRQSNENNAQQDQNLFPTIGDLKAAIKPDQAELLNTNRKKLDTPQWSTESVESSDDVLQTSESDKSHMVSRSSTISHSPISGQESSPLVQGLLHQAESSNSYQAENKEIVKHQDVLENRPQRVNPTPPLPKNMLTPPLLPPPQTSSDDSRNPYKRTSGLSHKAPNKFKPPQVFNQSGNLESLPDNSEHPDHPLVQNTGKANSSHQQWPQAENNEAPINDRNQYLETGQLSEVNLAEGNEPDQGNDTLPPPGLQRMVPGQLEQNEVRTDQQLPGFSRMVLGQNENRLDSSNQSSSQFDLSGPPEGLHRMIPGESSSPETSLRQPHIEENDSELELSHLTQNHGVQPPRSATIGADTPPIQTQPSLIQSIGSDLSISLGGDISDTPQAVGVLSSDSKTGKSHKSKEKIEQQERRQAVEGQTNDDSISSITNAVRNLTVGENLTDGHTSNNSIPEQSPRRASRQESSDSESDRKNSRTHRDKRSGEKSKSREKDRERYKDGERDRYRDRNSDRYSPDPYRDKRDNRTRRYRDRRYEDDTDYYSDKDKERRGRDDRDREYEHKYSSLRKDKDKRRKERDSREYRDSRRNDYYYSRYTDEYGPENRSSRPSSRTDSMHESYRESRHPPDARDRRPRERDNREGERERYRAREYRNMYNPYQNFSIDPYNPYYQQYQYYENLRRTNPQAYADWYRKYYQQAAGSNASFTGEDRASVHSGRSSANDELAKDRYTRQSFYSQSNYYGQSHSISGHYGLDSSSIGYNRTLDTTENSLLYEEQVAASQRLTPTKYATAHMKAAISSGKFVRILPHYPMDGQNAVVELCDFQVFLENEPDYIELSSFPGPLIKGVTHKKQIIEYCDGKIRGAANNRDIVDNESYVLMWELLILLIRQNGMVVGADIAELLLKNRNFEPTPRPPSVLSTTSSKNEISEASNHQISEHGSTQSILKEEEVTRKFREYLLYGSCQEALECAMKFGLWGHALFLASKLDKRTYANVMMRFANGLTMNDPLQTLYQLLSGKMPAVVTCCSDEKWGDWRPHLAMILSNSTQRPELNCKAITQLGDTLLTRGSLYAAQFCYLMAEVGFGKHTDSGTRLVLLGSDHRKPFPQFVTNEAVHMTEIYEFACSLNDQSFHISEFLFYKYLLATRLADFGLLQRSLQYLELIAARIISNPNGVTPALVDGVYELSDKLKFYDLVGEAEDESEFGGALETSRPDNSWLKDLRAIQNDYQSGKITRDVFGYGTNQDLHQTLTTDNTLQQSPYNQGNDAWEQEQQQYDQEQQRQFEQYNQQEQIWTPEQPTIGYPENQTQSNNMLNQYQDQANYWAGQQQAQPWGEQINQYSQESVANQQDTQTGYYDNTISQTEPKVEKDQQPEEPLVPQISMPNQPKGEPLPQEQQNNKQETSKSKPQSPKQESTQTTGWFGGIFSKLSMRPKNQMKLPEDKNPKIVWDETKKKWTNMDEDPNDPVNEFKPPPKMADLMPKTQIPTDQRNMATGPMSLPVISGEDVVAPLKPMQSNMFKMQKNRNVKNAYVDVFKQNGVKSNMEGIPPPENVPMVAPTQMNFFIPQPMANANASLDFLTPGGAPVQIGEPQISRWSSTSSLSREVASYMIKDK
ncbi:unnamed protein product [Ceutorhynchus assimilis]|uniref:Sec16 Sec23-binding domain-containing protein n=1 Tax=Ceutorhynchus assimilis TaxID=467358 RepID=A0A9P0DN40_9CUCU|nr:unnamed protein product [Ceutorhynchus assimilis]